MREAIADLHSIVHQALAAVSPLEKYRPGQKRRATFEGVSMVMEDTPGPDFNRVLVLDTSPAEKIFALAATFFGNAATYSITIEVDTAKEMEDVLQSRGWMLDEDEPALVLPSPPAAFPAAPTDLSIRQVENAAGLTDFLTLTETPDYIVPSVAAAMDPAVALFVGYVENRPVASSRLVCLGPIAELTGIVTAAEFRRRGFGTALTWTAIAEGSARGCSVATLTATPMGYPVYVRMGFHPVSSYRTYLPPE